jgi:hypothetical protein
MSVDLQEIDGRQRKMHGNRYSEIAGVRRSLRTCLRARGYDVASDSHGLRGELYIVGEGDLARALFEFKADAAEACDTMYQGSWVAGMPPRFAVMPATESRSPELDLLGQIRVVPLFYEAREGGIEFAGLDSLLAEHVDV